jgi:hypothetical protein
VSHSQDCARKRAGEAAVINGRGRVGSGLQTAGQSRTRQVSTGYRRIWLRHCHKTKASISPHTIRAGIHPRSRTMKNAMITSRTAGAVRASQSRGVIFRMERNLATWCECPQAGHFQSAFGRLLSGPECPRSGGKQTVSYLAEINDSCRYRRHLRERRLAPRLQTFRVALA